MFTTIATTVITTIVTLIVVAIGLYYFIKWLGSL